MKRREQYEDGNVNGARHEELDSRTLRAKARQGLSVVAMERLGLADLMSIVNDYMHPGATSEPPVDKLP